MRDAILLGSTGSIGTQALEVCAHEGITVAGLAAGGGNVRVLAEQAAATRAPVLAIARPQAREGLTAALSDLGAGRRFPFPEILTGPEASAELASRGGPRTTVLNGITGAVGLSATLAALRSGAQLALANKESLVVGGALVADAMVRPGQITPVDSEHSAMFQALRSGVHHRGLTSANQDGASEVARLVLTASGGPFRGADRTDLQGVTVEDALAHPTWDMGPVVTINSSTLINKALELIEAVLLFDVSASDIDVVVHPQSIVHSMVTFRDGSTIAQASPPDMRLPIALALTEPERVYPAPRLDFTAAQSWTFEPVDTDVFPATELARAAVTASSTHPAVLNAANEVCVDRFLAGTLPYLAIVDTVAEVLAAHEWPTNRAPSLEDLRDIDQWARQQASERCTTWPI
ncbi:MAG: 1-deoxy-D-xylulose-5-phosphate reductoisomerase [Bowdeniella nasicola]|nr:1-deoxy-D-xylulose-5-phosphate reductoisomerase [Bowdeniella nasicola]